MPASNIAAVVFALAAHLEERTLLYLADDDSQAEAIAAALAALVPDGRIVFIPASDALPGELAPASPANAGRRTAALSRLRALGRDLSHPFACILSGEAAAQRYAAPDLYDPAPPILRRDQSIDPVDFEPVLLELGYQADDRVDEPGEYALRGEVIDIFPADAGFPVRLQIADGRVASLRSYDPLSQRSFEECDALPIGRAAEPATDRFVTILDHMPAAWLGLSEKAQARRRRYIRLAADVAGRKGRVVDATEEEAWQAALDGWQLLEPLGLGAEPVPRFVEAKSPLSACERFLHPLLAGRSFLLVGSDRDIRFLRGRLEKRLGIELEEAPTWAEISSLTPGRGGYCRMPVTQGLVSGTHVVVAAADLLGSRALLSDGASSPAPPTPFSTGDVRIGDLIIHEDHGVGRIAGLEPAPGADGGEMIALEYAQGGRRLIAPSDAGRLWRYGADPDAVSLDRLDGKSWEKRRIDVEAAVAESARALAALAAERLGLEAEVIEPDVSAYERFTATFPFNETVDQLRAIEAVRSDLASGKPMNRLVVGDVGYGKTEVALRAAALTALAGYQVAIAAPTTVLVRQHLETFEGRFRETGLRVAALSRLSTAGEKKAVRAGLADGSIDIVIGTGAVMGSSTPYARLGLVIIDEEQRFGAADKARLRGDGRRHLLTLSATPIPRTLQMALVGLQTLSLITTPPARRQPIRTSIDQFDNVRVRTALLREKSRGGQSFVVVPRIEDMADLSERLRRIAPELALVEAHGKMPASRIDEVMVDFARGDADILLATNIIEAGLDIPRANTMIVWRADRFGLAQLHQLRGRVGRGSRRGQVYLLTEEGAQIAPRTLKRLSTLAAFDRLGAGFEISQHDLDMRGAGDLGGEAQAGHVKLVGVDLYQHLLERALRGARGEQDDDWTPDLRLGQPGVLPEAWIPEADVRLAIYLRLARVTENAELDALEEELLDRFGPLPGAAETLLTWSRIAILARLRRIARIDAGPRGIALTPAPDFQADPGAIGLTRKSGRWLLSEALDEVHRLVRTLALLEALQP